MRSPTALSIPPIPRACSRAIVCTARAAAVIAVLSTAVLSGPAQADVSGPASATDGDTIRIATISMGGVRIRLHGIDAPESEQLCCAGGAEWQCGLHATRALAERVRGRHVVCEERDRDRYRRIVALCRADGRDLAAWLVSEGWALAYRRYSADYVGQEASARAAGRGLWRGAFVATWDWRAGARQSSACRSAPRKKDPDPRTCLVKGNIARSGERIYHVPGGKYYERTRIDPAKGERWFCTEAEARASGWRRSRR